MSTEGQPTSCPRSTRPPGRSSSPTVLGRVTFANQAAAQLIGLAPDRISGRHFSTLLSRGHPMAQLEQITARVAAGQRWSGPIVTRRQDAARLDLELAVSPVRDAEGAVSGSVTLLRDLRAERSTSPTC